MGAKSPVWVPSKERFGLASLLTRKNRTMRVTPLFDVGKKKDQDRWLRHLLEPRYFEEWRKGCFHSPLCLNAELFEALMAERTVLELATVSLLGEPFSAVPTLHYCCNTHSHLSPPFYWYHFHRLS